MKWGITLVCLCWPQIHRRAFIELLGKAVNTNICSDSMITQYSLQTQKPGKSHVGCSEFIIATCRDSMHQRTLETRLARYAARAFRYSFLAASVFLLYAYKDQIMKNYD